VDADEAAGVDDIDNDDDVGDIEDGANNADLSNVKSDK